MNKSNNETRLRAMDRLIHYILVFLLAMSIPLSAETGPDSTKSYLMIGHAHIDPVWRWTKDEGYQEVFATFRSALDRMNEFPDVCFVASSAQFYQWVAEADPRMFAEIKARVKQGRWNIVGGWWIEPDVNCVAGESLVRQGLYGQRFFRQNFGVQARIGFNPDTFGHPWTLPQILRLQELEAYFFMRPEKNEKPDLPAPIFYWQGPDNSKIMTVQIIGAYNGNARDIEGRIQQYGNRFSQDMPEIDTYALFYGVGNHGGGPTIDAIEKIIQLGKSKFHGLRFGTVDAYIDQIRPWSDSFPVVKGELQHHARGCYSACASIKLWNRQAEAALISAEMISSFATARIGRAYPSETLRSCWQKLLFNQFHDILAGSAIEQAYGDAGDDYGYVFSQTKDLTTAALHQIASKVVTADERHPHSAPFIVFNPCTFPVARAIEIEMQRLVRNVIPVLRDEKGEPVPYQVIRTAAVKVDNRIRIVFQANLTGLGYRLYRLDFDQQEMLEPQPGIQVGKSFLENALVKVTFDETAGYMSSFYDKQNNRELVKNHAAVPIILDDWDDTWGHKIVAYDREIGRAANPNFIIMETGPERGRIQIEYSFGRSRILQDFTLYRNSVELDCRVTVDWHEHKRVLKLGFSTVLDDGRLTYSIPYGFIERPQNGEEEPGLAWIDLSGSDKNGSFGLSLINNGKCGYSVKEGEMRMTVLHSTAWSHHNPALVNEDDGYRFMEQGRHEFGYQLVPHNGDWRQGLIVQKATSYLMSPVSLLTTNHKGVLPPSDCLLSIDMPNVAAMALKVSEDEKAYILRCVELFGQESNGTLQSSYFKNAIRIKMRPCEIKSYRMPLNRKGAITPVNLLEDEME